MTVTFAGLVVIAAGGGAVAIFITMLPMLVIAYSFQRLNRWEANCGAQYVWVGRAVGPRLGFMTRWTVLGALMLGTVATVLPVGPSFLDLLGLNSSSQFGSVASSTILMVIVLIVAILGITLTARVQIVMAAIEYAIVGVLTVIGLQNLHLAAERIRVAQLVLAQPDRRWWSRQSRWHTPALGLLDRRLGCIALRR